MIVSVLAFDQVCEDRSGDTPPIYGEVTDQRIRKVLDQPPPKGFARWNGSLIARALGDIDVQYVCWCGL
jgi:hypothetical protein